MHVSANRNTPPPRIWKSPNPSVTIPSAHNVSMKRMENDFWTVYKIVVLDTPDTYVVEKRFSAFAELHSILCDLYGKSVVPAFAKSSFFENKFQKEVIERRRLDLERYMNALLTNSTLGNSAPVKDFLQPFEPESVARQSTAVVAGIEQNSASQSAQNMPVGPYYLPPIPRGMKIPNKFVFRTGEAIQLTPVLQEGCNALLYLSNTYHALSSIGSDDTKRGSLLMEQAQSIETVSQSLQQQNVYLETVLKTSAGQVGSDIAIHLTSCLSAMEQGIQYTQELLQELAVFASLQTALRDSLQDDESIHNNNREPEETGSPPPSYSPNLQKQNSGERGVPINLHKNDLVENNNSPINLKKEEDSEPNIYPELADEKAISSPIVLSKDEPDEIIDGNDASDERHVHDVAELQIELYSLRKRVDTLLINAAESDSKEETSPVVHKLQAIRADVRNTCEVVESTEETKSILNQFRLLGAEIAESCERLSTREYGHVPQGDPVAAVESKLFDIIQQVHDTPVADVNAAKALKVRMKKVKELLRQMRHHERFSKAQLARLEDLQENLSDLQHEFGKKFKLPSKKRDVAAQTVLDIRVKQAQKHHQAIEDDMFGL